MCGIIATTAPLSIDLLESIYTGEKFTARGDHSFGCLMIDTVNKAWKVVKNIKKDEYFKAYEAEDKSKSNVFIYHNRWASTGKANDIDIAHPVVGKKWIVVHNGTVNGIGDIGFAKSDTDCFARYFLDIDELREYYLSNAGVMFALNLVDFEIYFHKDGSRSLFYDVKNNIIASEPLKVFGNEWFPIETEDFTKLSEGLQYFTVNREFVDVEKKTSFTIKCDICGKRSSNGIKHGAKDICYSCLSSVDFDINKLLAPKNYSAGGGRV